METPPIWNAGFQRAKFLEVHGSNYGRGFARACVALLALDDCQRTHYPSNQGMYGKALNPKP